MTELYRLQRTQTVAELGSERIDALEIGIKGEHERIDYALAAFDMDKRDTILRESNGYNVDNGRTTHRGLEYELGLRPLPALSLAVAGSFARHEYAFTRAIEGGENIERGNDIDTAPRRTLGLRLGWAPLANLRTEAEWLVVGEYWLDAANTRRYGGHELLNLRAAWEPSPGWSLGARLDNALDRAYADRADFAFGNYRYFPGRGRTLFLSLDWRSE
jgi:outer membrane receptor protein involved in Fe transport